MTDCWNFWISGWIWIHRMSWKNHLHILQSLFNCILVIAYKGFQQQSYNTYRTAVESLSNKMWCVVVKIGSFYRHSTSLNNLWVNVKAWNLLIFVRLVDLGSAGVGELEVVVKVSNYKVPTKIIDKGFRVFAVQFMPKIPNRHVAYVMFSDESVPGKCLIAD